jgi:hypothetical protein
VLFLPRYYNPIGNISATGLFDDGLISNGRDAALQRSDSAARCACPANLMMLQRFEAAKRRLLITKSRSGTTQGDLLFKFRIQKFRIPNLKWIPFPRLLL